MRVRIWFTKFTINFKNTKLKTLFITIFYFFRSVYYRGLFNTLAIGKSEKQYESEFGVTTSGIVKSDNKDNFHYQGAGYLALLRVFNELPHELKNKALIDYGSGKGRALFCAEYCGFNHLIGVELDENLHRASIQNLANYKKKRSESKIEFVLQNALDYSIPSNAGIFYFFNPFSDSVMEKVADKIIRHSETNHTPVYVVYLNPTYKSLWEAKGFTIYKTIKTNRYTEAIIYKFG